MTAVQETAYPAVPTLTALSQNALDSKRTYTRRNRNSEVTITVVNPLVWEHAMRMKRDHGYTKVTVISETEVHLS